VQGIDKSVLGAGPRNPTIRGGIRVSVKLAHDDGTRNAWGRGQVNGAQLTGELAADADLSSCTVQEYPAALFVSLPGVRWLGINPSLVDRVFYDWVIQEFGSGRW
jgi:hypothetical protein